MNNKDENDSEIDAILSEFPDDELETEIPLPIEIPKQDIQPPEPIFKLLPLNKYLELTGNGLTIIAKSSKTGKTSLVLNLLKHNAKKFHCVQVLCSTTDVQLSY